MVESWTFASAVSVLDISQRHLGWMRLRVWLQRWRIRSSRLAIMHHHMWTTTAAGKKYLPWFSANRFFLYKRIDLGVSFKSHWMFGQHQVVRIPWQFLACCIPTTSELSVTSGSPVAGPPAIWPRQRRAAAGCLMEAPMLDATSIRFQSLLLFFGIFLFGRVLFFLGGQKKLKEIECGETQIVVFHEGRILMEQPKASIHCGDPYSEWSDTLETSHLFRT